MSQFSFDYEFYFTNDFDADVILESDAPDKSQAFQDFINGKVQEIKIILGLHNGVHKFSTFCEENSIRYKVTLEIL